MELIVHISIKAMSKLKRLVLKHAAGIKLSTLELTALAHTSYQSFALDLGGATCIN